ncbi:MAG: lanthionine synthetase C family protein [Candidatus Sulfotelmatobacter sp.]
MIERLTLREEAGSVGKATLARLADREKVHTLVSEMPPPVSLGLKRHWSPISLALGDVGHAITFGYLHQLYPSEGWDRVAHVYMKEATAGLNEIPTVPLGLFGGLTGLTSAARYLSMDGKRYQKALAVLDGRLFALTRSWLSSLPPDGGVPVSTYDLISGLTGIGRYLLAAAISSTEAEQLAFDLFRLMIRWSLIPETTGFYTPPDLVPEFEMRRDPTLGSGYINCGLAHGVPGPLALMALAYRSGIQIPGLTDAIYTLAYWLKGTLLETPSGPDIPYHVSLTLDRVQPGVTRTAWCYGNPGAARALQLAGNALHDAVLQTESLRLMRGVAIRLPQVRNIPAPTFCHGMAGVLQVLLRYLDDSSQPDALLVSFAEDILQAILTRYDPLATTGFQDLEPGNGLVANPGLLEGASGVALVLLGASSGVETTWDTHFLLS